MSKHSSNCKCAMESRRRFLKTLTSAPLLGLSASPAAALFTTILAGHSQKAWASSLGLTPKRLVIISDFGGSAAYMYDQFFTPYSSPGFQPSPMVGTQFKLQNGRYIGVDYVTHAMKGIQVGTMWTHAVPGPNQSNRPMSNLLDNLLSVQGIDTRSGGHGQSALWSHLSPGAKQSTAALAGDPSDAPFAALNIGVPYFQYLSKAAKTAVNPSMGTFGGSNPLTRLLDPFAKVGSPSYQAKRLDAGTAFNSLMPLLDELALSGHIGAQSLIQNRSSAIDLVNFNFGDLVAQWDALRMKYQDLITRAIYNPSQPLPGFNDSPIGHGGTGPAQHYQFDGQSSGFALHLAGDVRDVIDANTNVAGLADRFAFAEFVLLRELCGSIAFDINYLYNLKNLQGGDPGALGTDQHATGLYPSMYFNVLRFRAVSACLLELIEQLKSADMFNDTIIRVGGEFIRNTRVTMDGSDHGWEGARYNFYSGAFNGPLIVGKLTSNSPGNQLGWGMGRSVPELGRRLNLVDLAILTAHLIGVEAPFTSGMPIVTLGSNGLASRIGLTDHDALA